MIKVRALNKAFGGLRAERSQFRSSSAVVVQSIKVQRGRQEHRVISSQEAAAGF